MSFYPFVLSLLTQSMQDCLVWKQTASYDFPDMTKSHALEFFTTASENHSQMDIIPGFSFGVA